MLLRFSLQTERVPLLARPAVFPEHALAAVNLTSGGKVIRQDTLLTS
jgi:hypothetical protein